jgi:hypothetical protein
LGICEGSAEDTPTLSIAAEVLDNLWDSVELEVSDIASEFAKQLNAALCDMLDVISLRVDMVSSKVKFWAACSAVSEVIDWAIVELGSEAGWEIIVAMLVMNLVWVWAVSMV